MLTQYIRAALREAQYELMENGRYFASIPSCEGAWGEGATVEDAREELEGALESWIIVGIRFGHTLPVVAGIDLNPQPAYAEAD
ncbi:MAG: hypothetical protein K1X78_15855 [Verrucomicrobiaceae bacterium]|nr:hypothetical protein [Verrucomicrobiaceae bacterium]